MEKVSMPYGDLGCFHGEMVSEDYLLQKFQCPDGLLGYFHQFTPNFNVPQLGIFHPDRLNKY